MAIQGKLQLALDVFELVLGGCMRQLSFIFLILLTVAATIWMTAGRQPQAEFRYITGSELRTLDPQRISWVEDRRVAECLFEGLVRAEIPSLEIGPAVANRWEISADGLTYTFFLRDDARWSNGDAVTAEDFRFAWQRAILADSAADYSSLLFVIQGAKDFFQYRQNQLSNYAKTPAEQRPSPQKLWETACKQFDETVGINAVDAHTLSVRLEQPCPYFLELLSFITFVPVHRASVLPQMTPDPATGMMLLNPLWTQPKRLMTNGPYTLAQRRFKRDLLLTANPHYWNRHAQQNQSILILIMSDPRTALLAYQRGEAHWLADLPTASPLAADLVGQFRQGLRNDIHIVSGAGTYFYNFNCSPTLPNGTANPLADARVRRALALTIDRRAIVSRITRSGQPIALTFTPPDAIAQYHPPTQAGADYNPALAQQLLAQAGYPDGKNFPSNALSILYNTEGSHQDIAQQIKNHWEQTLHIQVGLEGVEKNVFGERLRKHDYTISRAAWFGDYRDPTTFLDKFLANNGNNDAVYRNPAFDALLEQAAAERTPALRMQMLANAEAMMLTDQPIAPIYHYINLSIHRPEIVQGLDVNPWQLYRLEFVKITPKAPLP